MTGKCALAAAVVALAVRADAVVYHVDAIFGDDARDGLSVESAWRTLDRANAAQLNPGDEMRFRRGCIWRGGLLPRSGEPGRPVLYSAYGEGDKPTFQRSIDRSRPEDWTEVRPGIWSTHQARPRRTGVLAAFDAGQGDWFGSFQQGSGGFVQKLKDEGGEFIRISCGKKPRSATDGAIQVWGPPCGRLSDAMLLRMQVRHASDLKLSDSSVSVLRMGPPWSVAASGVPVVRQQDPASNGWREVAVLLCRTDLRETTGLHLRWMLGSALSEGDDLDVRMLALYSVDLDMSVFIRSDIGNVILNHGERWGRKRIGAEKPLTDELDFVYDGISGCVRMKCERNPGEAFASVELAKTAGIVGLGGRHDIVFDGLAVRYGAGHGFGGGDTRNIVIRNCDISWMGGGLQYWLTSPKGVRYPVRYGNGIEFWGACSGNLVERNRLWQIYDAALTNQSNNEPRAQEDVVWRDNVIWKCEYSYEYWNMDSRSATRNIVFEHNTCVDAGGGWGHAQRPDPNGAHLMFYQNAAPTENFIVRNNIFCGTTDRSTRLCNDWRARGDSTAGIRLEANAYFIPTNVVFECHRDEPARFLSGEAEFGRYRATMDMDARSKYGAFDFVDARKNDYRLKEGTFGARWTENGEPVGARYGVQREIN